MGLTKRWHMLLLSYMAKQQMLLIQNTTNDWKKSRFLFTVTSVVYKKTLSGICCMKLGVHIYNKHMLIAQDCIKFPGTGWGAYCMTEISCKQLC